VRKPYLARLLEISLNNATIPSDWKKKKPQRFLFTKGVIDRQSHTIIMPEITANYDRMSRQALTMVARPNWSEQNLAKTVCHQSEKSDTIRGSLDGNSGQYNHHTVTPTV
jgi:hypothetical protein